MIRSVIIIVILLAPFFCKAQTDSTTYITIRDNGVVKTVKMVIPKQILIIDGDSMYTIQDEYLLRKTMSQKDGFDIINDEEAIIKILRQRIKAIMIVKTKKEGER